MQGFVGAQLVVSRDKDLLDLMNAASPEARELLAEHPDFRVMSPPQFLTLVAPVP
jgi:hypothetical protein